MKKLILAVAVVLFTQVSFAGGITVQNVISRVSKDASSSEELLSLLSKVNLKDTKCDIQFYRGGSYEVLCNTDRNSLIAFVNYDLSSNEELVIEVRENEQVNIGVGPIRP